MMMTTTMMMTYEDEDVKMIKTVMITIMTKVKMINMANKLVNENAESGDISCIYIGD